jgi:hypothetical protein
MKAITQDDVILEMFYQWPKMSPSQCWERYQGFMVNRMGLKFPGSVPLTSIRRSFTDLTDVEFLIKTAEKVTGVYGRPEYVWRRNVT